MDYAICYVSTASKDISMQEINNLLEQSKKENSGRNIKGLLLYSEGNFLQILEGEKKQVLQLYGKITEDPRHHTIIQILGREIKQGSFDDYKADVISEKDRYRQGLPEEYMEAFKGMDRDAQQVIERILEVYIMTRG